MAIASISPSTFPFSTKKIAAPIPSELDIVMTDKYLITGHDQDIFQLRDFFQRLQRSKKLQEQYMSQSPGYLLYYIIEDLLESCFPKIDHINKNLDKVEEEIFKGNEKEMVHEISYVKRDILNFRRTLKPQKSVLESLARDNYPMIDADLRSYYQDLVGTNIRVWSALENAKETIESLEETNDALLSNKLNTTMKVLTIFSAVMLPMTVISSILSMSMNIPLSHNPHAFWIYVGGNACDFRDYDYYFQGEEVDLRTSLKCKNQNLNFQKKYSNLHPYLHLQ